MVNFIYIRLNSKNIPNGVMIVFTNYRYLENCFNLWKFDNKKPTFREFKDKRLSEYQI